MMHPYNIFSPIPFPYHYEELLCDYIVEGYLEDAREEKYNSMKCYVLTVSRFFPKGHPKEKQPTRFIDKIRSGEKIHTIRMNYDWWAKRFEKINKGEAYLSIRYWSGLPYRSNQEEAFRFDHTHGIGLEKLKVINNEAYAVNGQLIMPDTLANKDGLSYEDFKEWFKDADKKPKALIHFTSQRYNPNPKP